MVIYWCLYAFPADPNCVPPPICVAGQLPRCAACLPATVGATNIPEYLAQLGLVSREHGQETTNIRKPIGHNVFLFRKIRVSESFLLIIRGKTQKVPDLAAI